MIYVYLVKLVQLALILILASHLLNLEFPYTQSTMGDDPRADIKHSLLELLCYSSTNRRIQWNLHQAYFVPELFRDRILLANLEK